MASRDGTAIAVPAAAGAALDYPTPSSNRATAAEGTDDPAAAVSQGNDTTDSAVPMSPGSLSGSHLHRRVAQSACEDNQDGAR